MEVKHTPGPWKVCVGNSGSVFGDLNTDHKGDNPYIGTVAGIGIDINIPECTANAALIAAAPDMLSAFKQIAIGPMGETKGNFIARIRILAEEMIEKATA